MEARSTLHDWAGSDTQSSKTVGEEYCPPTKFHLDSSEHVTIGRNDCIQMGWSRKVEIPNIDIHEYCDSNVALNGWFDKFYIWVSVHHKSIIYNKPTRCNSGSIVFINNYKYALHVSDALCVHHQEHYKL